MGKAELAFHTRPNSKAQLDRSVQIRASPGQFKPKRVDVAPNWSTSGQHGALCYQNWPGLKGMLKQDADDMAVLVRNIRMLPRLAPVQWGSSRGCAWNWRGAKWRPSAAGVGQEISARRSADVERIRPKLAKLALDSTGIESSLVDARSMWGSIDIDRRTF